ncbi:hypothetical protein [uncultured Lactobacillus sp.]|uniref:hypothetical protein n=1 Tax=uncultured Lactobacillus sp. TaxID=153152 RepID=UPI00261D19C8|nr:hypothetical protein [uncultured Lactobacillus sp.]
MPSFVYGKDLANQVQATAIVRNKQPFSDWQVNKFQIGKKNYYLFVENSSFLTVVTDKLDENVFYAVLESILSELGYITVYQQTAILDSLKKQKFSFVRNDKSVNEIADTNLAVLKDAASDLEVEFESMPIQNKDDKNLLFSLMLMEQMDSEPFFVTHIALRANRFFPVKTHRPKKGVKYWNIEADFESLDTWKEYAGKSVSENKSVVKEIKRNNMKLLTQYLDNTNLPFNFHKKEIKKQLKQYLNEYLLFDQISFANSNLGDLNYYVWMFTKSLDLEGFDMIILLFEDFYEFLMHTGMITQADFQKIKRMMLRLQLRQEDEVEDADDELAEFDAEDTDAKISALIDKVYQHPDEYREMLDKNLLPEDIADVIRIILDEYE